MNLLDGFLDDLRKVQPGEQANISQEGCSWLVGEIEGMQKRLVEYERIERLRALASTITKGEGD
jgi:hypothetical protein